MTKTYAKSKILSEEVLAKLVDSCEGYELPPEDQYHHIISKDYRDTVKSETGIDLGYRYK